MEEIDDALRRVEDGSYGLCLSCQEQGKTPTKSLISQSRLKVIPYAKNCVECERKREELHIDGIKQGLPSHSRRTN